MWTAPAGAVDLQPLRAQARRVAQQLDAVGAPLTAAEREGIDHATSAESVERVLDAHALLHIIINPEQRVRLEHPTGQNAAAPALQANAWTVFLVRIDNQAGTTAPLCITSPQAAPVHAGAWDNSPHPPQTITAEQASERWTDVSLLPDPSFHDALSGLDVEYRVVQLYCASPVPPPTAPFYREATFSADVGAGTQDLAHRNEAAILFKCQPAVPIHLHLLDEHGEPTTAALVIRDAAGRIWPLKSKRLAPDMFFEPQVYRHDGDVVELAPGRYDVTCSRGPEYYSHHMNVAVPGASNWTIHLQRWIDPAALGWISGDDHIHAAGCAHYTSPTEGVTPADMQKQIAGEDLKIGCALTWGPCFDFQQRYFRGAPDPVSTAHNILRYDVEVSGFGSHQAGHLVLLGLHQQQYPGSHLTEGWPTLGLSVLQWAKRQGAVTATAHSGWGIAIGGTQLPSMQMPKFDGIGANEYIVDVTQHVVDLYGMMDTPSTWELNMWYHTLNVGFRTKLAGETDFPCISEDRVGAGRSYVHIPEPSHLDFDAWLQALQAGRSYASDGRSHLIDFRVNGVEVGASDVTLGAPGNVIVTARVAALLPEQPDTDLAHRPLDQKPYWHLERARLAGSRRVPLEVVVDGRPVASQSIEADGHMREVRFEVPLQQSSWIALRILPSSHTNPIWVNVSGQPLAVSRSSARWCLDAVDACWSQKARTYAPAELEAARAAYERARHIYRQLLTAARVD
jgi:hypothetical protein